MKLDNEWIDFIKKHEKSIKDLNKRVNEDLNNRLNIIKKIDEFVIGRKSRKGVYNGQTYVSQYTDVELSDVNACIETYIMKNAFSEKPYEKYDKLYIALWTRNNQNYKNLDNLVKALNCKSPKEYATEGKYAWGKHYVLDEIDLTEEFSIQEIAKKVNSYLDSLSKFENS